MRAPDDAPENNRREFPIIIIINTSRQLTRTSRTLTNIYPSMMITKAIVVNDISIET